VNRAQDRDLLDRRATLDFGQAPVPRVRVFPIIYKPTQIRTKLVDSLSPIGRL